jgi:hypothetical protein
MNARHGPGWRFDRRGFLRLALSGLGAAVPAIGHSAEPGIAPPWRLPDTGVDPGEALERYFDDTDLSAAAVLGRNRVMTFPDGGEVLRSRVTDTLRAIAEATDVDDALARLDRAVRDDFDQLRLESLHGWQLARTEIDLCVAAWWLSKAEPATDKVAP